MLHRVARLASLAGSAGEGVLQVSVQTRAVPHANDSDAADLSIRLRPATTGRLPSRDGLTDLREALPLLPEAISMRAPQTVRVTGGAHLTVAFALGSALPATLVGNVTAEGTDDSVWQTGTVSAPPSAVALTRIEGHGARPVTATGTAKNVLAYVDHIRGRLGGAGRHDLPERPHRDGFGGDVVDGVVEARGVYEQLSIPVDRAFHAATPTDVATAG